MCVWWQRVFSLCVSCDRGLCVCGQILSFKAGPFVDEKTSEGVIDEAVSDSVRWKDGESSLTTRTHSHTHRHTHTHTHTHTHARTHSLTLTHSRTLTRTRTHARTHAHAHTHTHACYDWYSQTYCMQYTTHQKYIIIIRIIKIFSKCFHKKSLMLTKAAFIWSLDSKNSNIVKYYYIFKIIVLYLNIL